MTNDRLKLIAAFIGCALWSTASYAQQPGPSAPAAQASLSLSDAVQLALANYPAVQEQRARARAAEERIAVTRTAYLPRIDAVWQEYRATHNNVFGLLFPGVLQPVSGPVLPKTAESVWGSAVGALVSWDAVDFGQRKAAVEAARAEGQAAAARSQQAELDAASAAADAFLTVLAADAAVRAAQANVDRLQVFGNAVTTLVTNQLRPGADQSRAEAELALARNQLAQAQQNVDLARASLAEAVGRPGARIELVPGRLSELPPAPSVAAGVDMHPAARAALAAVDAVRARERVLQRAALPRIALQSAASARGSGADVPGLVNTSDGLWPRVPNWTAGVFISLPVSGLFTLKPQKRVEAQNEIAERARYDQTIADLQTQQLRAQALLTAASAIAQNMPVVRRAADETQQRARARYDSGLTSITEVAEAQHLLAQAEADDAVARLAVWRALLAQAQAAGDLTPFLDRLRVP